MSALDRLSVRIEVTNAQNVLTQNVNRKIVNLPKNDETTAANERLLYFSPNDAENPTNIPKNKMEDTAPEKVMMEPKNTSVNTLHDTILATQLRHINRELTPTISEVYHERNIGLGLAPPLAKLLLNQTSTAAPQTDNSVLEKITLGILEEADINAEMNNVLQCPRCKLDVALCNCKAIKSTKPWLSENASSLQQIQSSDLTTADILEREVKNKLVLRAETNQKEETEAPFSEMSRRDEGDGRSIADSSSSSYKGTQFRNYHTADKVKPSVRVRNATLALMQRRSKHE